MQAPLRLASDTWTTTFLENHDQARSITRWASSHPQHRIASGKLLALICTTLSGTLFIYQGQEIGMINFPESWGIEEYKDVDSTNYYKMVKEKGGDLKAAMRSLGHLARDHARVPFSWSTAPHNGFSPPDAKAKPWMRPLDDAEVCNAKDQVGDKGSVLAFWKKMLGVRREENDLCVHGAFEDLDVESEEGFVFTKSWQGRRALVVCNFTNEARELRVPEEVGGVKRELLVSSLDREDEAELGAWEGRLYLLA